MDINAVVDNPFTGTFLQYKERERSALTEAEEGIDKENRRKLEEGIYSLRRLKAAILDPSRESTSQEALQESRDFSSKLACALLDQCLLDSPISSRHYFYL